MRGRQFAPLLFPFLSYSKNTHDSLISTGNDLLAKRRPPLLGGLPRSPSQRMRLAQLSLIVVMQLLACDGREIAGDTTVLRGEG